MLRYLFSIFIISMLLFESKAQLRTDFLLSNGTMFSSGEQLPFWLWANREGKIEKENSFINLTEASAAGLYFFNDSNSFVKAGTNLVGGIGNKSSYFQPSQLFAGVNLNNWEFNLGMYYNEEQFGGLSTSNGNMANSRNFRPYPRLALRVAQYKPVPFVGKWFSFKGEFEEGILLDERFVDNTHIHHKSLYLKLNIGKRFDIQAGLEHFVMWGGTSSNEKVGELPGSFNDYIQYITGSSGGSNFSASDQLNVAGNQYGSYQLLLTQGFDKFDVSLNFSHPFEDHSGMDMRSWPDELLGVYLKFKDRDKFITEIIYEYTSTLQQGINDSLYRWINKEEGYWRVHDDNYFNHGAYRSGVTHYGQTMGSPFFFPTVNESGTSEGFKSTRFFAHHIGAKGVILQDIYWKSMLTYIEHFGSYTKVFEPKQKQVSGFLEFIYSGDLLPVDLGLTIAGDIANSVQDKIGFQFSISKTW